MPETGIYPMRPLFVEQHLPAPLPKPPDKDTLWVVWEGELAAGRLKH